MLLWGWSGRAGRPKVVPDKMGNRDGGWRKRWMKALRDYLSLVVYDSEILN